MLIRVAKITNNMEAVIEQSGYGLSYKSWPSVTFNLSVWESNADKIGVLDKESASQVAYFYTMHASALACLKENESLEIEPVGVKDGKADHHSNRFIRENLYGAWQSFCEMERIGNDFLEKTPSAEPDEYPTL